jgi:hypothetical protein
MSRKPIGEGKHVSKEISFNSLVKQLEQPDSLVNYLPEDFRLAVLELPEPLVNQSEEDLLELLKRQFSYEPSPTHEALRHNFWMEFERAFANRKDNLMTLTNVYMGVCSREYFSRITHEMPHVLAYILTRSPEYDAIQAGMLSLATKRVRDILNIPLRKVDGSLQDPKILELVLKAAAMVDLRNKGGYINRSETKNMTMIEQNTKHTYTGMFTAASNDGTKTAATLAQDIKAQLESLEKEMSQTPEPPSPKFDDKQIVEAEYKEVSQ